MKTLIAIFTIGLLAFVISERRDNTVGAAVAPPPSMGFFVTSAKSKTGNLGGLDGADKTCQTLAAAVGQGEKAIKPARIGNCATLVRSKLRIRDGIRPRTHAAHRDCVSVGAHDLQAIAGGVTPDLAGDYLLAMLPPTRSHESEAVETHAATVRVLPRGFTEPSRTIRPSWPSQAINALQNLLSTQWVERTVFAACSSTALGKNRELVAVYAEPPRMGGDPSNRELRGVVVDPIE